MQNVNPDYEKAKILLNKAIWNNDLYAAYALGTWYFHGIYGVTEDKEKAIELWKLSSNGKLADALFDMAVCYEEGIYIKKIYGRHFLSTLVPH